MKKLKVLFITSKFPRFEGDPQPPFAFDLARELIKKGLDIHVVAPHHYKSKNYEVFHGIKVHRFRYFYPTKLQKLAYGAGIPANVRKSFLAKLQIIPFTISEILKTREIVKKINPDIIHVHWAFPQGLAAMLSGKPYIATIYGGEVFLARKYHLIKILDKIIRNSKKSFAITNGLKKVMREFGIKSSIDVIPLGVDTKKFHPNINGSSIIKKKYCKKSELMVLCVGRLVEKKGIKYLIKAFELVLKKIPKCKLIIVGDGYLYGELINLAKKLKIENNVIFTKEINHKELPKYYDAADLFVLPSIIDSTGNRETQGVVYVEAMACKCPVIGTRTGGIPEVISNSEVGILVKQKNSGELADRMIYLLKNDKQRKKLADNAYNHALENFKWEVISKKYVDIYSDIK